MLKPRTFFSIQEPLRGFLFPVTFQVNPLTSATGGDPISHCAGGAKVQRIKCLVDANQSVEEPVTIMSIPRSSQCFLGGGKTRKVLWWFLG